MVWHHIFLLCISFISYYAHGYKAIVISPVADLVSTPMNLQEYQSIPLCGGLKNPFISCKRVHQLLFQEIVNVVEQTSTFACIEVPSIFYITSNNPTKRYNRYWVEKKHILGTEHIADHHKLPSVLSPECTSLCDQEVALIDPHYDATLNITFPVGTRFIRSHGMDNPNTICVWSLNPTTKTWISLLIPSKKCHTPSSSIQDRIADFVRLVRHWAHLEHGYIPYVWGGSSSVTYALSEVFHELSVNKDNSTTSYYTIDGYSPYPMTGFDCSSLISRAAQICNIPYFFKNTTTLAHFLAPVDHDTPIENGDLIWIPWHVMVVSDIDNNMLTEARSYIHGYGKVHELPLHKVFKNMQTYQELKCAMLSKKPIERLHKSGKVADTFKTFKILKLKSIFNDAIHQAL